MESKQNSKAVSKNNQIKLVISKIHIALKFSCWLFIEYTIDGQSKKTPQFKVDPKQKQYLIQEEIILKRQRIFSNQDQLLLYIKLISSKGISFTAGILSITPKDLLKHSNNCKSLLNKSIDPQSFVQYYVSSTLYDEIHIQHHLKSQSNKYSQSSKSLPDEFENNSDLKLKIRQLQLELQSVRAAYQLLKIKNARESQQKSTNGGRDMLTLSKEYKKWEQILDQAKKKQKQMLSRIELLEVQHSKSSSLIQKHKEIILMLQTSQKILSEQKLELKAQVKANQNQLQEKRTKIRQLESQKINLMMKVITTEKQINFMKERVYQSILKIYKKALKITTLRQEQCVSQKLNSFASFSASACRKEGQSQISYKMNSPSHKHIMKDQVPWLQQSVGYRQNGLLEISQSSGMNDISISNIKQKNKEEVSLLNSGMFVKTHQTLNRTANNQIFKSISDQVKLYSSKIIEIIANYHVACQKQLRELREALRRVSEHNNEYQRNEQSLLGHLQQLQGGLQSQLQIASQKDQRLTNAEESIRLLESQLQEKNQLIAQLQTAVFALEEEKEELKKEIHHNNYAFAKREEQIIMSFQNIEVSPPKHSSPFSPLIKSKRQSKREKPFSEQIDSHLYNGQILEYKQKIKLLQLQLSHERHQSKQLRHVLQNSEGERRKLQFAMKLKQRMQVLNQSIEMSRQQCQVQRQGEEQKSKKYQQQILKVLI